MATARVRKAAIAGLGVLGAGALGLGVALWQRTALAEWLVLRALRARGVPAELRVERLDLRGAALADVVLGPAREPDLTLARADLAWSWEGLRAGRLERVALRGLRLRARLEGGLQLGALDALRANGPAGGGGPLALPFLEAQLEDAQAVIDSTQGALRLSASGNARPEGEVVRAELALHGESRAGALDFGGGGTVDLASQEIGAVGTLAGSTPWGRLEGLVRVEGTLASLHANLSGTAQPDAAALPFGTSAPIRVSGDATRGPDGTIEARAVFAASGVSVTDLATLAEVSGEAALESGTGGLTVDAKFVASGAVLPGVGSAERVEGTGVLRNDRVEARAALRAVELAAGAQAANAELRGSYAIGNGALDAHVEAPRVLVPELARLDGLSADVALVGGALSGEVRVAKLVELSAPALIAPLRVQAKLGGSPQDVTFDAAAHTPGDGLTFELRGSLATSRAHLELRVSLPETDLSRPARQPARVFPWLAGVITAMRGGVGLDGLATYADGKLAGSGVIALNGADLVTEWGTIRGLMGVVTATAIDPLQTPPGQTVWMNAVEAGLPLGAGMLKFQLRPDGILAVEDGEWGLAEGKLRFAGTIPLEAEERAIDLRVEGVSLEKLLAALDFEGLTGTGSLTGVVPILQRGGELLVRDGDLHAMQKGVIRFTPGEGGSALSRKQPALAPLLGALENLEYDELTLLMNGDLSDRVDVKLHIRGRNPNYQKGRPVVLNVDVDLPLGGLMRAAAVATGVPDEIEEQVQRAMSKEKP